MQRYNSGSGTPLKEVEGRSQRERRVPLRFKEYRNDDTIMIENLKLSYADNKNEDSMKNEFKNATAYAKLCSKNGQSLATIASLENKKLPFNSQFLMKCDNCEEVFCTHSAFRMHAQTHMKSDKENSSSENNAQEIVERSLKAMEEAFEATYRCMECNKIFLRKDSVRRHYKEVHVAIKKFLCEQCGASFKNADNLKHHIVTHSDENPFKCTECRKHFKTNYELTLHVRTHTLVRPYTCEVCQKSFSYLSNLNAHKRLHTNDRPFHCSKCGATFNRSTHLKNHLMLHLREDAKSMNQTNTQAMADNSKSLTSQSMKHQTISTNLQDSTPDSTVIPQLTASQIERLLPSGTSLLKLNVNDQNENVDNESLTPTKQTISNYDHLPEKPIILDVQILPNLFTLDKNVNILKNVQPPLESNSNTPNVLKQCYKYQCTTCFKHFKQKSALTRHLRTHTGEKIYACPHCPKRFTDASNCKKHKKSHINNLGELDNAIVQFSNKEMCNTCTTAPSPTHSTASDPDPDGFEIAQRVPGDSNYVSNVSSPAASVDEDHVWHVDADVVLPLLNMRRNALRSDNITDENSNVRKIVRVSYKDTQNPVEDKTTTYYIALN